jgi:predicted secreted protein
MIRRCALLLVLVVVDTKFGPEAVWHPDAGFRRSVISMCEGRAAGFMKCFAEQMKAAGASSQALAFMHAINDNGYMQAFRPLGPIAVASLMYPFRANENSGLLIVNGQPLVIDVDALSNLPEAEMKANLAYQALLKEHPNATLWPGDRASTDDLLALVFEDGSRQLVAGYRVQAGCHACAVLGQAFVGFSFDTAGKLISSKFSGFTTDYRGSGAAQQKILSVGPDTTFSVLLPANRTTGYSWTIDSSSASGELRRLSHTYESSGTRVGTGGEERFSFHAAGRGESRVVFGYSRPWEKNATPQKTLEIVVRVQ